MARKTGNLHMNTAFRNGGRKAGIGITYDDYGDESGNPDYEKHTRVRFPNDNIKPEELNGPVICYKGESKMGVDV